MNLPVDLPLSAIGLPSIETLDPSILRGLIILIFGFFIAILIGLSRRFLISSSMQGIWSGLVMGIIILLAVEGTIFWFYRDFIVGDRAANLPPNLQLVLDDSKKGITQVLGSHVEEDIPEARDVISDYKRLSPIDAELIHNSICVEPAITEK